ncbi:uncharacterized protein VTP21DRAFT_182 [Calcarisporiella thermophila]|uniref:uncharacterized protein n=1 Tax=Calcarisporiella thermophila TaxID=911321 RepID=UPI003743B623
MSSNFKYLSESNGCSGSSQPPSPDSGSPSIAPIDRSNNSSNEPRRKGPTAYRKMSVLGLDVPGVVQTRFPKEVEDRIAEIGSKLVVAMVGLPARGKSYIVKKLTRYLNWLQYETKVFNVGNRRREKAASDEKCTGKSVDHSHNFFDPSNAEAKHLRDQLAMDTLEELIAWLKSGGRVGILDATNSTIERRKLILDRCSKESNIRVLFVESICTDKNVLEKNMHLKLSGPDYKSKNPEEALRDFKMRVANYERAYQTIGEEEEANDVQYCKLINVGKKVIAHNISGYLSGQCIFYLMNFNLAARQIWLTRHGESTDNMVGRIGGDASLSPKGHKFGHTLARFIRHQRQIFKEEQGLLSHPLIDYSDHQFAVWTSMLARSQETVEDFDPHEFDIKCIRMLNEIDAGICEGLTYEEIRQRYPSEYELRAKNKLAYRYPGGESYLDVIHRLQPLIIELERMTSSCLIVTHRVVMRILLAYLLDWHYLDMPNMHVPLHTIYCLEPREYGTVLKRFQYNSDTDWFDEIKESTHGAP